MYYASFNILIFGCFVCNQYLYILYNIIFPFKIDQSEECTDFDKDVFFQMFQFLQKWSQMIVTWT